VLDLSIQLTALACALAVMLITWVLSIAMRDASIADVAWGLAFAAIAWGCFAAGDGVQSRKLVIAILVTIWGGRLALHIAARHEGEDRRYVAMREKHPDNFVLWSLGSVFIVQSLIAWVVSIPIQLAAADPTPETLGILAVLGALVVIGGIACEALADSQLEDFKRDPESKDKVMDKGLWRYSRHPNYFGDTCVWWGVWLIALETGSAWWGFIGPAVMTYFLLRVSGVALTERSIGSRRPGYEEYVRRTSAFIPLPPKKRAD
jgi:steroid 5-alpha reductase family enzyme